jgi:hypothetical protein
MEKTPRGFTIKKFKDHYGVSCSIQKSSLANKDAIWLGIEDPQPKIMASQVMPGGTGWVDYPIHPAVHITTSMHLTQDQVKELLPLLQNFVETGKLEEPEAVADYII